MTPNRWAEVERLYHAALTREVGERMAFLREACIGDEGLRREVEALLAQSASGDFMARPVIAVAADLVSTPEASVLTGRRIGVYQIQALLGAGGMGEVYRARDTKLGRDVAIKMLPSEFTSHPDRLARFQREARVLASLNHPHIGAIYGIEDAPCEAGPHVHALVLELVEGQTLADRIARGPVPVAEVLTLARQVAEALEEAHEKGIVHRDLKPANIKIAPNGTVKVLDFGLAKAATSDGSTPDLTQSPTVTFGGTRDGVILGTAAYMSPEQARGSQVDKRTDVWAFGCVVYEMLTGCRAFRAPTAAETLVAILERDVDWTKLPSSTPSHVRTMLRRALEKDPKRRLHDIADARIELEDEMAARAALPNADGPRGRRMMLAWASTLVVVIAAFALVNWYLRGASPTPAIPAGVTRLLVASEAPLAAESEGMVALSPDGRHLSYVATADGHQQIYLRELTQFEGKALVGTQGGDSPAFSPDGQWLAFLADRRVKKISIAGGSPVTLFEFAEGLGLSWESNEAILFSPGRATGIWRVSAAGGNATTVTTLHDGESSHRDPQSLQDGKALLYSALSGSNNVRVFAQSLETGQRRAIDVGAGARYLPTGHVVYTKDGTLFAVPFDPVRLEATGRPVPVLEGVRQTPIGTPQIAFSQTGSMVYVAANAAGSQGQTDLVWVTRSGEEEPASVSGAGFQMPRLSPDANRVVVAASRGGAASIGTVGDLWMYDLARDTRSRLTFNGASSFPLWSPDGTRLAYSSGQTGQFQIHLKSLGSGTSDELLSSDRGTNYPLSWSRDGRYLASVSVDTKTFNDIWVTGIVEHPTWRPFVQTPFREGAPTFSHDGRWMAYASDQSGRSEIYMRPFPGPGEEWTISIDGGTEPLWAKSAGQLFYRHGDEMMVVDVNTGPTVTASKPRRLFEKRYIRSTGFWPNYDVAGDGQRFLIVKGGAEEAPVHVNVVLNWQEELKRLVPTR